jgi:hypothetical protein
MHFFTFIEITYNSEPSQEYLEKAYSLIKNRVALGGYRLAELLKIIKTEYNKIHGSTNTEILEFLK